MSIYGLLIGCSIVFVIDQILKIEKRIKGIDIIFILTLAIISSRILFIFHNLEEIRTEVINPFAIYDGGLTIFGAIIGLLLALSTISRYRHIPFLHLTDTILLYIPLAQSVGRWGNFFNQELYGRPSELPWAIYIPLQKRLPGYESFSTYHPTFLYESILNLLHFVLLKYLHTKKLKEGIITSLYLLIYGTIRFLMNRIRIDGEYLWGIETSDILSVISIIGGILLFTYVYRYKKSY